MITVAQNAAFEAVFESGETGLIPGLEFAIIDNDGVTVYGPTTNGLTENEVDGNGTGVYTCEVPAAPADLGQFTIVWSRDGTFLPASVSVEDLLVLTEEEAQGQLPAIPTGSDGGSLWGPCTSWTDPARIDDFCDLPASSNPFEIIASLEEAAAAASQLLWAMSGRQFNGLCQKAARPCRIGCTCGFQVLSRGHIVWGGDTWLCDESTPCGCSSVSEVLLSGYPVREIIDVTIDGESVPDDEYELREHRFLVRLGDERWPGCQSMNVAAGEPGSFVVTYLHGQTPPQAGINAASQLACQIFKAGIGAEDCVLPSAARRITRQGITVDANYFTRDESGRWVTGMPFVDAFLTAVNPNGLVRQPTFWAPGRRFARTV